MSPLQKIAMGMVIVIGTAPFPPHPSPCWEKYDALPNPLGWLLVAMGTVQLTRANPAFASSRGLAAVAGAVSVPLWFPQIGHLLASDPCPSQGSFSVTSAEWFVSLPQIVFCLVLAREIGTTGALQQPSDRYVPKRFGLLVWGFALVGVLPAVAFGGGLRQLATATLLVSQLVYVVFIYFLFRVHRREWLGGPGPLEVHPRPAPGAPKDKPRENREGRPPSR